MTKSAQIKRYHPNLPMTGEQFSKAVYEAFETGTKSREYGFRIRTIADGTGDKRLIDAAYGWRKDYDMAVLAIRERPENAVRMPWDPNRPGYEEAVTAASKRLERAYREMGIFLSNVLMLILVGDQADSTNRYAPFNGEQLSKRMGVNPHVASGYAMAALERLAEIND